MKPSAGFFDFRWLADTDVLGAEDIAVLFKVAGSVDMAVLPDLIESVCLGPIVPSAVVMIHLKQDETLLPALESPSVANALLRFNGRMPFIVIALDLDSLSISIAKCTGLDEKKKREFHKRFSVIGDWIRAGLRDAFNPSDVIVPAPPGYAFYKPSSRRSSFFLRADMALSTSSAVSFVALAIFCRLVQSYGRIPAELRLLFVDTMSVVSTAFALRELLAIAGVSPLPQVESFHSYGGMHSIGSPLPDTSLCIVSASSSMNLHREWIASKSLSARDIVTLVTFDDVPGAEQALYALPAKLRPEELKPSAKYDIHIAGEHFFPVMEQPRKVLLITTHHGCKEFTDIFNEYHGKGVFGAYRAAVNSETRRGLFIESQALLKQHSFRRWMDITVPQSLKIGTTQVIAQDDDASRELAQHIAFIIQKLGGKLPEIILANDVGSDTVDKYGAIICVAAIVGKGNSILSLSRELRNCHLGARVYVIGMQVAEDSAAVETFNKNLRFSSHKAYIEVVRMTTCLTSSSVEESFSQELALLQRANSALPPMLSKRAQMLRQGLEPTSLFLPSGSDVSHHLKLNKDFSFWKNDYEEGLYQGEVLGTIATILQNARTSKLKSEVQRLRSPLLMHVALDPENFARFNEGVIQASLLRAALPSELDYRGDAAASEYMAQLLKRLATKFDHPQQATLEFLIAIAIGRMQLNPGDVQAVKDAFENAAIRGDEMSHSVHFLLGNFPRVGQPRAAF